MLTPTSTNIDIRDLVRLLDDVVAYRKLATELKVALEELLDRPYERVAALEVLDEARRLLKGEK